MNKCRYWTTILENIWDPSYTAKGSQTKRIRVPRGWKHIKRNPSLRSDHCWKVELKAAAAFLAPKVGFKRSPVDGRWGRTGGDLGQSHFDGGSRLTGSPVEIHSPTAALCRTIEIPPGVNESTSGGKTVVSWLWVREDTWALLFLKQKLKGATE